MVVRDGIGVLLLAAAATKTIDYENSVAALALRLGLRRAKFVLPI